MLLVAIPVSRWMYASFSLSSYVLMGAWKMPWASSQRSSLRTVWAVSEP